MPKLYHISETENIQTFIPRQSKKQWNYEKYVWAISDDKLHNYLLPRACPRICLEAKDVAILEKWIPSISIQDKKAIIIVHQDWVERIQNCTLFRYEFEDSNFKSIDAIAGYWVSETTETPIHTVKINDCITVLEQLNIELITVNRETMIAIKDEVVKHLTSFSIIKWNNFE